MTADRPARFRRRSLLAAAVVVAALGAAAVAVADRDRVIGRDLVAEVEPQVTVLTRNLYNGTGVGAVFAASSESELVAAGSRAWADLLASDFPTRAAALADEIVQAHPDVVGLQEVTLWRDQVPGDVLTQPAPDATHVAFDHLALLREELRARGTAYTAVVTSTGADVEFPRQDPAAGLVDVRLTDRDVLLVRSDRVRRASNPGRGHYTAQFSEPSFTALVESTRSWTSIDYRAGPTTTVRVLNTHLEVGEPETGTTQQDQAAEFLALARSSPYPVVAVGDFNAPAGGSGTPTYQLLTAELADAWTAAGPGLTCCQAPPLADPVRREGVRIDLVLTGSGLTVTRVAVTGDQPFRTAPPPLWASDHFGVTAQVVAPVRRRAAGSSAGRRRRGPGPAARERPPGCG